MKTKHLPTAAVALSLAFAAQACSSSSDDSNPKSKLPADLPAVYDPGSPYVVDIDAGDLSSSVTNAFFPVKPGAKWVYESKAGDVTERIEITVEAGEKDVWGAKASIVRDTVHLGEELIEDTWDWYAQDDNGHVWYLGEDTTEYKGGEPVCKCGAWEAGVKAALPGVIMPNEPVVGHVYRQEFAAGEAEDYAEIVSIKASVTVPAGKFENCVKTRDRSALDKTADAFKYYCPGVGLTLEEEGGERVELIEYSGL